MKLWKVNAVPTLGSKGSSAVEVLQLVARAAGWKEITVKVLFLGKRSCCVINLRPKAQGTGLTFFG